MIWDVGTGKVITKYRGHNAAVYSVKFNADCTVVATSSYDATVRLWDLRSNAYEAIQVIACARVCLFYHAVLFFLTHTQIHTHTHTHTHTYTHTQTHAAPTL